MPSQTLAIHVISNGDLIKTIFDGIVAVMGSSTFATAIRIAAAFSVISAAFAYTKSRDFVGIVRWFALYFAITVIMLGPKVGVEIIDSSNPGAVNKVDNVPIGLVLPASIITSISYGLQKEFEKVFHMPNDVRYSRTGMLFGSKLFRLSSVAPLPKDLAHKINLYFKSCVVGDILIRHLYTITDLSQSKNILDLITTSPSVARGLYINGNFTTCAAYAPMLKASVQAVSNNDLIIMGKRIWGSKFHNAGSLIKRYLPSSYQQYTGISQSATDILNQNLMINGVRNGVQSYAADTGSSAGLENYAYTKGMMQMRLAWATSKNIASETLPLLSTVLTALMFGMFPIIVLLGMQPGIGPSCIRKYIYTLLWIGSWPIFYTILNCMMTYYLYDKTGGYAPNGLTLSNQNPLLQEHSDVANMAGYLALAIPFISMGLVTGMASAFNMAANYLGGMAHGIASGTASEAVSGNISLGNVSYGNTSAMNLNANKHDTNFTSMQGMSTLQNANASTETMTASGDAVYNTQGAISQMPINVNAAAAISRSASMGLQHSISDASSKMMSYAQNHGIQQNDGQGFSVNSQTSHDQAMSNMLSIAHEVGQQHNISDQSALQGLTRASLNEQAGLEGSSGFSLLGNEAKVTAGINARGEQSTTSTHDNSFSHGVNSGLSDRQAKDFRDNLSIVENYAANHHLDTSNTQGQSLSNQVAADLRQASTFSSAVNLSQTQSGNIQSNFNQGFADYVKGNSPSQANAILTNTSSASVSAIRQTMAQNYLKQYEKSFISSAESGQLGGAFNQSASCGGLDSGYERGAAGVSSQGSALSSTGSPAGFKSSVTNKLDNARSTVLDGKQALGVSHESNQQNVKGQMETGKTNAQRGAVMGSIKNIEKDIKNIF